MRFRLLVFALLCLGLRVPARAADGGVRQMIVGIAPDWNSMRGRLQLFRRDARGEWQPASAPVPVLFGKNGLAWGRGVEGTDESGLHKQERDGRAPAGVFDIGTIYTYDAALPPGADYPFHQVTTADAWVDDAGSPDYNKFVTIPDPAHPPAWFEKMKMRHGDFAYRWLVEIRHNSDPPVPGAGSAIFFHIRRGESRPTSGCTTMAEPDLVKLVSWLRAADHPQYALLPWSEYQQKWRAWGLPDPAKVAAKP
jgi:L,D-peptidoglycan transpeptidase YkuD (ErfK/YbiS/YcfS/YnhG family)